MGLFSVIGSVLGARNQRKSAERASQAQQNMSREAIAEQRRQFDAMRGLQQPYVDAGNSALSGYQDLLGLNGNQSQAMAVGELERSPLLQAMYGQAENALLQNASATGGLRGGNTQEMLADNRINMLYQNVLDQKQNLAGIANMGQNAAAGVGSQGIATGNNIANQLNGIGASQAGYHMARGQANQNVINGITGSIAGVQNAMLTGMTGGLF